MFKSLIDWYQGALATGGYPLITLLMAMESSILPLPSEVVIPPAAHFAHSNGNMSLVGIVIAGTFGSWIGAAVMYWLSRLAGRPFIMRYGRYFFITPEKVYGAERWAAHYGAAGILAARLLPVVRHLIGIPAGIVRMDFFTYSIFTVVGSAAWTAILCWVGVTMGQDEQLLAGNVHRISLWLGGIVLVLTALYYFFVHRVMKKGKSDNPPYS
ncbi:MAG TPA: DedA family protein [Candidatus Eisenbacteria bacterium]|jgi:membrane protein DedA with SNARE-associated domain|nr:DedA family protein [Candidatus Eisenbacteria bacterium]